MTKILIFLTLPEQVRAAYHARLTEDFPELDIVLARTFEEACAEIADADILYTFGAMVRDELYGHARKLKWVQALGTGLDNIADAPLLPRQVMITSTRGIHGKPMSEAAIMFMLALARDFPRALKAQAAHRWERWPARLLAGKRVGILGVGLIAEELAPRCKAFDMTVVGISRTARPLPGFDEFRSRDSLEHAVGDLDYLILLVPLEVTVQTFVRRHDLPRLAAAGALGALLARQGEATLDDLEFDRLFGRRHDGLPEDLVNFMHDPLAVAAGCRWPGVTVEEIPIRLEWAGEEYLRTVEDAAGRAFRVVTAVDAHALLAHWLEVVAP